MLLKDRLSVSHHMLKSSNQNWCILFLFFFFNARKNRGVLEFFKGYIYTQFLYHCCYQIKGYIYTQFLYHCCYQIRLWNSSVPRNLVEHAENWTCFARPYCGQDCVENYIPRYSKIERWLIFNDRVRFKN